MISPAYSYGVQAVEVTVDPETGRYTLNNVTTAHESGTVINPVGIEGQLEGAIMMAGGYGYCEDQPMDDGKILNPSIADYKLIRSVDMPETQILEIDTYEPEGPFGAKEAGEGLTNPTAGALVMPFTMPLASAFTTCRQHRRRCSGLSRRKRLKKKKLRRGNNQETITK